MMIMTMIIMMCFLNHKGTQTHSAPGGGPINYNDYDDNDNDDEAIDDDDDDEHDEV